MQTITPASGKLIKFRKWNKSSIQVCLMMSFNLKSNLVLYNLSKSGKLMRQKVVSILITLLIKFYVFTDEQILLSALYLLYFWL